MSEPHAHPYRGAKHSRDRGPPRRRWRWGVPTLLLGALAAVSARSVERRAESTAAPPMEPALDRVALVSGGRHLCALTAEGARRVACANLATRGDEFNERRAPRVWTSPPLVQLVSQDASLGTEPAALGLLADGSVIAFGMDSANPRPFPLPRTGAHGPIVALYRETDLNDDFDRPRCPHGATAARTRDGAVLGATIGPREGPTSLEWTELFPASDGAPGDDVVLRGLEVCAATPRGVCCRASTSVYEDVERTAQSTELVALDAREVTRLVRAPGGLCALTRGERLRCAHNWWSEWSERRVVGLPERVAAVDGDEDDLCARGTDGRWSCTSGPSSRTPPDLSRSEITLHAEPALDGASSVVFHHDGGCARWADGRLRCWGRTLRDPHVLRRGATVIRGVDAVTSLAGGRDRMCALQRGALWCWGGRPPSAGETSEPSRPTRLPLPGAVSAVAPGFASVGADVWAWGGGPGARLPNPVEERGEVVSLAASSSGVCARRASGHVHCWHALSRRNEDAPASRYVAERVRGLEGFARLGARRDEVCAWTTGRGGRCWSHGMEARSTVREVDVAEVEDPVRVEGSCAVYSDDLRRCEDDGTTPASSREPCAIGGDGRVVCRRWSNEVNDDGRTVPVARWRAIPGVDRAVSLARYESDPPDEHASGCAALADGRVVCWGVNYGGSLSADARRAAPVGPLRW